MRSRPKKKHKSKQHRPYRCARVSAWAVTDVGLKRDHNEDSFLVDSELDLYIVADGMGGHAGGGVASQMAVETVRQKILQARLEGSIFDNKAAHGESKSVLLLLEEAVRLASDKIFSASSERPELTGMGTTSTLMLVHGCRGYIAHVGDSRLYRLRGGELTQLTEDHSLVNEQVKAGYITPEEAHRSRFKNIITRSVGFESQVTPDTFSVSLQEDDVFLICSDGLNGMVSDLDIARTVKNCRPVAAVSQLVAMAKKGGGEDNITLILLRYKILTNGRETTGLR